MIHIPTKLIVTARMSLAVIHSEMTILKFKKRIKVDKSIGNLKIQTQLRDSYENGKSKEWTELRLSYNCDCENCPCSWECQSYEGEREDCICMLPWWMKNIILKMKFRRKINDTYIENIK